MNNYYNIIIENIIENISDNAEILFLINNEYNILNTLSYIIKKKNIKINFVINNSDSYKNMVNNLKGEECENNIKIYEIIDNIDKKIDLFVMFYLDSIESLDNYLLNIKHMLNKNYKIYIYCNLCKDVKNISFKNSIRKRIINYTNNNIGYILPYVDVITLITKNYKITSIKIYKKNNYIIYGYNTIYKIVLDDK